MATFEQVEKLREKANVTYEDAKAALDASNGDLLDALIYLEKQGKVNAPSGGGYYTSSSAEEDKSAPGTGTERQARPTGSFAEAMRKIGRFCANVFRIGNSNYLEAEKNGETLISCPVTALILLLIFFFWVVVPLLIIGLFFGFRYHIRGRELGTDAVNKVMDGASATAEDIKKNFQDEK
ncbi:ubiquitin [Oscillospiraceae bacterium WX1]